MKPNEMNDTKPAGNAADGLIRGISGALLLLPALICLIIAALMMRPGTPPAAAVGGLWLVLAGVLLYGGALFVRPRLPAKLPPLPPVLRWSHIRTKAESFTPRPLLLGVGIGLLLVLAEVNGRAFTEWRLAAHGQAALLVAGCALVVVGFAGKDKTQKPNAEGKENSLTQRRKAEEPQSEEEKEKKPNTKAQRHEAAKSQENNIPVEARYTAPHPTNASSRFNPFGRPHGVAPTTVGRFKAFLFSPLGLLTIFAFLLYLWRVDQTLHIWIDEFHFAEQIVRLWREPARPLLPPNPGIAAFTSAYAYLQALAVSLFGADLFGLRFVSAVFGALTVPATYFLAHELLNVKERDSTQSREEAKAQGEKEKSLTQRRKGLKAQGQQLNAEPQRDRGAEGNVGTHHDVSVNEKIPLRFSASFAPLRFDLFSFPFFAALFIALFPPHLHFSRIGLNNIADPLFGVLALAFFTRGLRTGGAAHYALAGVMLGLTQYFYEGGKLLYPPLFAAYLLLVLIVWRPFGQWRGVLVTLFCAGIVALPIYYTAWATSGTLTPRLDEKARGLPEAIMSDLREGRFDEVWELNLRPPILHFTTLPDSSTFFYGGETGILLSYLQPLFWLGIAVAVWRLRVIGALLILWLLATIGGNMLIGDNTYTARYVVALPALAVLIMLGVREIWAFVFGIDEKHHAGENDVSVGARHVSPLQQNSSLRTSAPSMPLRFKSFASSAPLRFILFVVIVLPNVLYYFGPHLDAANQQIRKFYDHIDVLYRARELPPGTHLYIIAGEPNFGLTNSIWGIHYGILSSFWDYHPTVDIWLAGDPLTVEAIAGLSDGIPRVFFIEEGDTATLAALQARYPALSAGQFSPYASVPRDKQYVMYFAEAR